MMMASRPPPSPSRRASAAVLPGGPPPPSRRASLASIPRRASVAAQQAGTSSSSRQQHYADIPMIDSDEGSQAGSEQRHPVNLPPPPRTLSRRASNVAVARSGSTPREDDTQRPSQHEAGGQPASGFAHYEFPIETAAPPPQQQQQRQQPVEASNVRPMKQRAQSAVFLNPQSYSSSTFYDPSIQAYSNNNNNNAPPKSQSPPNPQQTPPLTFTQPAPAPQLLPPPPQQASSGAIQLSNPLRNPHAKVSGVEFHAPLPRLQATTEHAADRTRDAVYQFMEQLCPERATAVQSVMDQFSGRETLLMEAITSIFGDEWASHRKRHSNLLALEAAQNDVKSIMPVALRHEPKEVHTTYQVLDDNSPLRLRIEDRGEARITSAPSYPSGATMVHGSVAAGVYGSVGGEPLTTIPAVDNSARQYPPHTSSQPSPITTTTNTPRDYLPPSSSRGSRTVPLGVLSEDIIHHTASYPSHQNPTGINNSRPSTPMLSVQRSVSNANDAPQYHHTTQPAANTFLNSASSGRRTTSPPNELTTVAALDNIVSLLPPPSSDPVMMVMATPSNGGILTPPLPDELVYQPQSHSTTHWRR